MDSYGVTAVIPLRLPASGGRVRPGAPPGTTRSNVGSLANMLLATWKTAGVKQMIFSSSAAVYGMPPGEEVVPETSLPPHQPHGGTKYSG